MDKNFMGYVPTESDEQEMVVEWAEVVSRFVPDLEMLSHVPNGGFRMKATAARLKKEGVKPGFPDLSLPVPNEKYHGLYIEMKRRDHSNRPSKAQKWWITRLRKKGYKAEVCYGAEEAIRLICEYLDIEIEEENDLWMRGLI